MRLRNKQGAALGLAVGLTVTLLIVGLCLFYLTKILGGSKQSANATDAGALTAARSILAVSVPTNSLSTEFQGLGVNPHTGAPDPNRGSMNILAYNRAAGLATLVALNAIEDGSVQGKQNASNLIKGTPGSLTDFGNALNNRILASGQLGNQSAQDFETSATRNNVNMMGPRTATHLTANLDFRAVRTGPINLASGQQDPGKSNVYFHSFIENDPVLKALSTQAEDSTGQIQSVANPNSNATSYAAQPTFQEGRPLLRAYQRLQFDPSIEPIYFAAVNPASQPHLIDAGRFNDSALQIGSAPVNAVMGQTLTRETSKSNTNISSIACAVIGAIFNEYPINISRGYVRVHNLPSAQSANYPKLNGLYGLTDGSGSLFNNELYLPKGGGINETDNGVFFARQAPNALAEATAYIQYNVSASDTSISPKDPNGRDPKLDPQVGKEFTADVQTQLAEQYNANPYKSKPFYPPNAQGSLRFGPGRNQQAALLNLLGMNSITAFCHDESYDANTPPECTESLAKWSSNFGAGVGAVTQLPDLTNLEALKAEVITNWYNYDRITHDRGYQNVVFTTDGSEFKQPSGSKLYNRDSTGYAVPKDIPSAAFGKIGTPFQLLQQLAQNQAPCNPNDPTQWADSKSLLGKFLIRCQEIMPAANATYVASLLNKLPLPLNGYQYIYSPDGGLSLTVSATPPSFLAGLPEYTKPGTTQCDGNPVPNCTDSNFANSVFHQVNSKKGVYGPNGDLDLESAPYVLPIWDPKTGGVNTSDFANFQTSTGYKNLLGDLSFGNNLTAKIDFTYPN